MAIPFSEKLRMLRERKGLSQSQLADALFVTRQAVSKWERGAGMPDLVSLQKIADYFGVTLDSLANDAKPVVLPPWPEPLGNRPPNKMHYLFDVLLSFGMDFALVLSVLFIMLMAYDYSLRVLFGFLLFFSVLAFFACPIGLHIHLRHQGAKGYWILTREIEVVSLASAVVSFVLAFFFRSANDAVWLFVFTGYCLSVYGVGLYLDLRLVRQAPKEVEA
jgi:transcriptional regulator with XRE-family HTH domain